MDGFKFCARLYFFFAVCSFGIVHAAEVTSTKSTPSFTFGGTYDNASFYHAGSPTCMTPDFLKRISESVTFSNQSDVISQSLGSSKMSKEGSVTTSTTVSVFWGLSSETTTHTTSTRSDNYSLTVNYTRDATSIALVNLFIPNIESGLNSEARKVYNGINIAIANQDPALASERYKQFRQMCGTGIITQMDAGFKFSFTLIFNFVSVIEKDGAVQIAGIKSFADAINLVNKRGVTPSGAKIKFSLNVVATQLGGDPSELAKLLKASGSIKKEGSTYSLTCEMGTTGDNPCTDLITSLIAYGGKIGNQILKDVNEPKIYDMNKLYFSNPTEFKYNQEAVGAEYIQNTNVNKGEQNRLWEQYLQDEKTNQYISRYLNYLNYIKSAYITKPVDLIEDRNAAEENKKALNDLIDKLQVTRAEYANIINLYNAPNVKALIKSCFTDVTRSCKDSADKVFELRAQEFNDKAKTDKLLNYLMNSEYMGDFYIKKSTIKRCNLMPISDIMPSQDSTDGLYFADCQKFKEEKPYFVMTIRYKGNRTSAINDFHYFVGNQVFYYTGYNQNTLDKETTNLTPETSDGDSSSSSASLESEYVSEYLGTMQLTILPKVFSNVPGYGERRGYSPRSNYPPELELSGAGAPVTIIEAVKVNIFRLVE